MLKGKFAMIIAAVMLAASGCSTGAKQPEKPAAESVSGGKTSKPESAKTKEKNPEPSIPMDEIASIQIPHDEASFRAQKPGIFTADIPYLEETKQVWGDFGLGSYKDELTKKLKALSEETEDPETIYKALHYFVGSSAYGQVAAELEEFSVSWFEPYLPEPGEMQNPNEKAPEPGQAMILLDASSSMLLNVEGKQKMLIAKRAASRFASTIGMNDKVSLIVYGHAGSQNDADKELSCTTIEEVYPMGAFDSKAFNNAVTNVEARGWTPIAGAIKFASEQAKDSSESVTLYIVSDGAETCGGDPVAEAKAFAESKPDRKVNIIGFDVSQKEEGQLKQVAQAGKGEYIAAKTIADLDKSITNNWVPSLSEVMGKSNSLLKHWGQGYNEMLERRKLSARFMYASSNEGDRMREALHIMQTNQWITSDIETEINAMIREKNRTAIEIKKELDEKARIRVKEDRQKIVNRVNDWMARMSEYRKAHGK